MDPTQSPGARQAAIAEQAAMKAAAMERSRRANAMGGAPGRTYPSYNVFIVIGVILTAIGSFVALLLRS
jgi:hypothetical protein